MMVKINITQGPYQMVGLVPTTAHYDLPQSSASKSALLANLLV